MPAPDILTPYEPVSDSARQDYAKQIADQSGVGNIDPNNIVGVRERRGFFQVGLKTDAQRAAGVSRGNQTIPFEGLTPFEDIKQSQQQEPLEPQEH